LFGPVSNIGLMGVAGHADETSSMNMHYNFNLIIGAILFECIVAVNSG